MIQALEPSASGSRPDYGIDAPGVRAGMFAIGFAGALIAILATLIGFSNRVSITLQAAGIVIAAYGLFMGFYMTYGSRVGKLRTREKLLDLVADFCPWKGNEAVLDVGCGRGLMLIGAARRLKVGKAIGIDLWQEEDQSGNSPASVHKNALREGVANRIRVDTGDARQMPYPDATFDIVLSHWVVHNLKVMTDRQLVLDEMVRVLRPGGIIVLADIANIAEYKTYLSNKGMSGIVTLDGGMEAAVMGVLSGGSYRPQALLARRT